MMVFTDTLKTIPESQTICFKEEALSHAGEGGIVGYSQGNTSLYRFLSKF